MNDDPDNSMKQSNQEEALKEDSKTGEVNTSLYTQLLNGKPGLASMFWAYGVLAGVVWIVAGATIGSSTIIGDSPNIYIYGSSVIGSTNPFVFLTGFGMLFVSAFIWYYIVVFRGIWKASNEYQGISAWPVLAKFWVIINSILFLGPCLRACGYNFQ